MWNIFTDKKGSVVVMAIIILAGILIVAVEFALFAISGLKQARSVDAGMIAFYAAESGAESALYQVRHGEVSGDPVALSRNESYSYSIDSETASWTFLDNGIFTDEVDSLLRSELKENDSIQIPLFDDGGKSILSSGPIHSMKVSWKNEVCASGVPWIEARVIEWDGGSDINWTEWSFEIDANTYPSREYVKTANPSTPREIIFNDIDINEIFSNTNPMIVRVKSLYCDLSGVQISFHDVDNAPDSTSMISIPYYRIKPVGSFANTQQAVELLVPTKTPLSSLYDYILFSEEDIGK